VVGYAVGAAVLVAFVASLAVLDTERGKRDANITGFGDADWVWREDAITELLAAHQDGSLFVAGWKSNQGIFYSQFDDVALLSAPADVPARIAARNSNPYGKARKNEI
jgi:hypothetical protein